LKEFITKTPWKPIRHDVLEPIKEYFGSYIAIYFGWLLHYTKILTIAAVVGTLVFIIELATGWGVDNKMAPFYAVFVAMWATFYIEFWKRRY
jgi:hypothetical protein